jgi:hypothetical protein
MPAPGAPPRPAAPQPHAPAAAPAHAAAPGHAAAAAGKWPGPTPAPAALIPNSFAFLANSAWRPDAPPSTGQPRYWVFRIVAVGPPPPSVASALIKVQWYQETQPHSGLYRPTPRHVSELARNLKPLSAQWDDSVRLLRVTGAFDEHGSYAEPL